MPSLIAPDNRFGGNCPENAPPPPGYRLAPHDPPAGMIAPTWDDSAQTWQPGTPVPIQLPGFLQS